MPGKNDHIEVIMSSIIMPVSGNFLYIAETMPGKFCYIRSMMSGKSRR